MRGTGGRSEIRPGCGPYLYASNYTDAYITYIDLINYPNEFLDVKLTH